MKTRVVSALLFALNLGAGALHAAPTAVPLLYRSDPTDAAASPHALVAREAASGAFGAHLASAPGGRLVVSFDRTDRAPGRFVYLGFTFTATSPFAVGVSSAASLASVAVAVNGNEFRPVLGRADVWGSPVTLTAPYSVVVRLERGDTSRVPVNVSLFGFASCPSLVSNPCGDVSNAPPGDLVYGIPAGAEGGPADVLIPAVVRAAGLHGNVRSDVSLVNESDAKIVTVLSLVAASGGESPAKPVTLAAHARVKIADVVGFLLGPDSDAQGALAIRGFVPSSPGSLAAETYYDNGDKGRIGSTLPLFVAGSPRDSVSILASSLDGDPRLILFSSAPAGSALSTHVAKIRIDLGNGALSVPVNVAGGVYGSARLSDLVGGGGPSGLVSIETDDPSIHAVIVRSDPVSGTPYLTASN
jgi:hypothetical protein